MKKVILSFMDGDVKRYFNASANSVEEDLDNNLVRVYGLRNEILGMFRTDMILTMVALEGENVKE